MSTSVPVVEEECQVKLLPAEPPIDHGKACTCCHSSSSTSDTSTGVEDECKVKSTYYNKLKSWFFSDFFSGPQPADPRGFQDLREECLRNQRLFVDDSFPPSNESISFNGVTSKHYEWRRPTEIVKEPHFVVEGATRFDIQQGELGDCWLLAAVSTLTMNPNTFLVVVPNDQGFHYKYAGIFHFRFWQYGKWEDIYVDDLLPTYKGRLVFMHSKTINEFWCALLEKAYAKLYGCYESLKGGNINEAMVDLTGGVVETINIRECSKKLFPLMEEACIRGAMLGCGIEPDSPHAPVEGRLSNGLITRHAYSVTKVVKVPFGRSTIELVRLHNPWGNEAEWKGAWSDQSREWKSVNEDTRKSLGIVFDDDGEFWMPFQDFARNFTTMDVCDVTPDVLTLSADNDISLKTPQQQKRQRLWKMKMHEGEWVPGVTAGGCRNYIETFPLNPQKVVLLDKVEDGSNDCTLVVSLMQKFVRQRKRFGVDFIPIGFAIYKLPPGVVPGKPLSTEFFTFNASCGKSPYFLNTREVSYHYKFPPGVYVVIPSTFEPNDKAEFLLRIFTESHGSTRS